MKYYRFKTFTTSYYFPNLDRNQRYMYGLYSPYGGKLSRIYWYLFRNIGTIRELTSVKEEDLPFPYDTIKNADGTDSLMAFNLGSPGEEQKISILGYDNRFQEPFFAKFSQKPSAQKLTQNEIKIYQLLDETGLTPRLLSFQEKSDYIYMKAEYVRGKRPDVMVITDDVLNLCIKLGQYHINRTSEHADDLVHCLSHGDFCPWNMLVNDGKIRLIDWEMADERPLGYDLFTYICQVSALFEPSKRLVDAIDNNMTAICHYFHQFGIEHYESYLKAFANMKVKYESGKGTSLLYPKYAELAAELCR